MEGNKKITIFCRRAEGNVVKLYKYVVGGPYQSADGTPAVMEYGPTGSRSRQATAMELSDFKHAWDGAEIYRISRRAKGRTTVARSFYGVVPGIMSSAEASGKRHQPALF